MISIENVGIESGLNLPLNDPWLTSSFKFDLGKIRTDKILYQYFKSWIFVDFLIIWNIYSDIYGSHYDAITAVDLIQNFI